MRQNAVSSAPQKLVATQSEATRAMMPAVVLDSRTSRSASLRVVSVAEGKSSWRSRRTERSRSGESRIWPAVNSAISATGKTESSRL